MIRRAVWTEEVIISAETMNVLTKPLNEVRLTGCADVNWIQKILKELSLKHSEATEGGIDAKEGKRTYKGTRHKP